LIGWEHSYPPNNPVRDGKTYRGLDICAILVKRKEKPDSDWICAFLKIHFTKEEKKSSGYISQKPAKLRNGAMKNK
jgi:hypothetical protein